MSALDQYKLVGWNNVCQLVGVGPQIIFRWTKLYGFPPATRKGRIGVLVWDRRDVVVWMRQNKDLVDEKIGQIKLMNQTKSGYKLWNRR